MEATISLSALQASLASAVVVVADAFLRLACALLWPGPRPGGAERVFVHRVWTLGDVVCALPALTAIRRAYPAARLTLVTAFVPGRTGARELLAGAPWLEEIIDEAELAGRRCDVWFELPPNIQTGRSLIRSFLLAWRSGADWARGWRLGTLRLMLRAQSERLAFPNEVDRLLEIVAAEGVEALDAEFRVPLTEANEARARGFVEGLSAAAGIVALAPGAGRPINRWPLDRFISVGRSLAARGCGVVVIGSPEEAALCREAAAAIGPRACALAGDVTVLDSCAVLKLCRVLICNDAAAQHLAAAVGTPAVSIFSSRDVRGKWHPYGPAHAVLRKQVECHTCLLSECPYESRCLTETSVDEVLQAALERLSGSVAA